MRPNLVIEVALKASKADGAIVLVSETSEATLRWANSTMTTNGHHSSRSFAVISVVGTSVGVVRGVGLDADEVRAAVAASEDVARKSGPARDVAPLAKGGAYGDFDSPAPETSIAVFDGLIGDLSTAFEDSRRDGNLLYGFAEHTLETIWLGSSTGLRRRWTQPTGTVELNGKVAADLTRSAWAGAYTKDFTDLDLAALSGEVTERLGWSQRRIELPAGHYETILPPCATSDMMINLVWSMDGRPAHEGRSPWSTGGGPDRPSTKLGEQLTELPLTLYSDPQADGLETEPFLTTSGSSDAISVFDNGVPVQRVEWIAKGTVGALAYPRAAADEFGAPFTPPPGNLLLTGNGTATVQDMVASTKRGLLLTCLWYIREVDPVTLLLTGLTRDGVYLVEDGAVVGAVNNFRFNESPIGLLRRASEVGVSGPTLCREWKDWFTRTSMPAIRIPDFNMSSVSEAS